MLLAGGAASSAGGNANKVSALFGERKSNNLFNGIWRLPNSEFDRAGNFSTHMGKCTTTLLELALQLKDAQVNTFVIYFRFDGRGLETRPVQCYTEEVSNSWQVNNATEAWLCFPEAWKLIFNPWCATKLEIFIAVKK